MRNENDPMKDLKEVWELKRNIACIVSVLILMLIVDLWFIVDFMKRSWMTPDYFLLILYVRFYSFSFIISFILIPFVWALRDKLFELHQPTREEETLDDVLFTMERLLRNLEGHPAQQGQVQDAIKKTQEKKATLTTNREERVKIMNDELKEKMRNIGKGVLLIMLSMGLLILVVIDVFTTELFHGHASLEEFFLILDTIAVLIARGFCILVASYAIAYGARLFFYKHDDHELLIDKEED